MVVLCGQHRVAAHLASLGDLDALHVAAALADHATRLQPAHASTAQRIHVLDAAHADEPLPADVAGGTLDAALAALWAGRLQDARQALELASLAGADGAQRRSLHVLLALLDGADAEVHAYLVHWCN